ncbi:hypothetical protein [Halococcus sp. IIIV-5B]|uniref:hypothetical protein n=1 Tax=Halococcus sp. IIIV-5B TaxID=2321230 RepID=UPI000E73A693|nr:hypothetical protein [Halococcus sp. IIIV-5B]RJT05473.1 hypothetical protein D3261_07300 [Halococcus sp. IIIV-5B]
MSDDTQTTLGGGEAAIDEGDDEDEPRTNDFGDELGEHETRGGYSRYTVSSLLQKAVRRSDEECAAWAAWELTRSGYAWNLWDRLALYVVEDLRAGDEVVLLVHRYERLANDHWSPEEWEGRLCAIHAALAAARATSTREATYANDYFERVAQERAEARRAGREPADDFPVGDLEPGGEFDVIFDQHTYEGAKMDRNGRYFTVHGARVGPEGESDLGERWRRRSLDLDDREYTDAERDHALAPVDPKNRWTEPDPSGDDEERE